MGKPNRVPIAPDVLRWAIRESGFSRDQVAESIGVDTADLQAWEKESASPTLTQFRKLASTLKRTPASLLLPSAPEVAPLSVQFRHPPNADRTKPSPEERRYLREAGRIQDAAKWIIGELGETVSKLPVYSTASDVEQVGQYARHKLLPMLPSPLSEWESHAQAFHSWRAAFEATGVLVFLFPLGKKSARGFSLWDELAPLIAVNTAWNHAARIFSLFHEYGHLLTRSSSVCLERSGPRLSKPTDKAERWCEEFAAAALLPWGGVETLLRRRFGWRPGALVEDLGVPRAIANAFKVSWRAATIRLIERGAASWDLYTKIPAFTDDKGGGGGGGGGRDRGEIKESQYGQRTVDLFVRALDRQVLGRGDVLDYLDVTDRALDRLQGAATDID